MTGWERLGIGGLSQGYLSGELSPPAVLDGVLARIAAVDGDLSRSWRSTLTAAARAPRRRTPSFKRGRWQGHLGWAPPARWRSTLHPGAFV